MRNRCLLARSYGRGTLALILSTVVSGVLATPSAPPSGPEAQPLLSRASRSAEQPTIIDFEHYPGPDGRLGTGDDLPTPPCGPPPISICHPLSDDYASLGLHFSSGTLAQGDVFPGSDPSNHFLSSTPPDVTFTTPVYGVAIDSYAVWNAVLYALDEADQVIATDTLINPSAGTGSFAGRLRVFSDQPITRLVVLPEGCDIGQPCDPILNLDNLTLWMTPPSTTSKTVTTCDDSSFQAALVGGGRIEFACDGTLVVPELVITADTVIDASGHQVTLSGNRSNRVFYVRRGVKLSLVHLAIAEGHASSMINDPASAGFGGGIFGAEGATVSLTNTTLMGNTADYSGGGIWNSEGGTLSLDHSTLTGNAANSFGGGIFSIGNLIVTHSTLNGNTVGYSGGGLLNAGVASLTNSTLSGNVSERFAGGIEAGGTLLITHGTLVGNSAAVSGSGISSGNVGSVTLINSVLANSGPGDNCAGGSASAWRDGGYNVVSDHSCLLDPASGSRADTNPRLGPLADHGGVTLTHAPLPGSPVIDAIPLARCPVSEDQRGVRRPGDGDGDGESLCDIGAVEGVGATERREGGGCTLGAPGGFDPSLPCLVWLGTLYLIVGPSVSRRNHPLVPGLSRPEPGR